MATFSILVTSSPFTGNQHRAAIRFIRAALPQHTIARVFFYGDAVLAANANQQAPQGQHSVISEWLELANESDLPLKACIANSLRRGIANNTEQERYQLSSAALHPTFELVGLGEMAEANLDSDRVVQF